MMNKEEQHDPRTKHIVQYHKNLYCPITQFQIFGERHSGTKYLRYVIEKNVRINLTTNYGHKHWIGSGCHWKKFMTAQNTLFICTVRNIYDWIGGMLNIPHHLSLPSNTFEALTTERFISWKLHSTTHEKITTFADRNYHTQAFYDSIFEARHWKNRFLYHYLPFLVDNMVLITYESFIKHHQAIVSFIKDYFELPRRRPYRILKEQQQETKDKKPYNFNEDQIITINNLTHWESEEIFGYNKRQPGMIYDKIVY